MIPFPYNSRMWHLSCSQALVLNEIDLPIHTILDVQQLLLDAHWNVLAMGRDSLPSMDVIELQELVELFNIDNLALPVKFSHQPPNQLN